MTEERTYYVYCDDNCRFEGMTKEQIYDAIAEATGETPTGVDDAFITKIKEQNAQHNIKVWKGTSAEYNALSTKSADTLYFVDTNVINTSFVDMIYPVGSLYWSTVSTDPSTLFGGTWEQIKDQFVLAAGDTYTAGSTGGEATHTLTVDEMPSHNHSISFAGNNVGDVDWHTEDYMAGITTQDTPCYMPFGYMGASIGNTGGGAAHNNMPPYMVAFCWKRTA